MAEAVTRSRPSRRSRIIAALKILLPVLALALLAAVFIWRQGEEDGIGLTFEAADIEAMRAGLNVTGPQLSGASLNGDLYDFRAAVVMPENMEISRVRVDTLTGKISFLDGRIIRLASDHAILDLMNQTITLEEGITMDSSDGYSASATKVALNTASSVLTAEGPILATAPQGEIRAADMVMEPADEGLGLNDPLIRFTGGVTLRYTPAAE